MTKLALLFAAAMLSTQAFAHRMSSMSADTDELLDTDGLTIEDCQKANGVSDDVSDTQIAVIYKELGDRTSRLHHALWHATRLSAGDQPADYSAFGAAWGTNHSYCPAPMANADAADYNHIGEDFLYMHRLMVQGVRKVLRDAKLKCIRGWNTIDDTKNWSIPDNDGQGPKSDDTLAQLEVWDKSLQDVSKNGWLASHSLSQLGMALELTTHNNLHMRFAAAKSPISAADASGGAPVPENAHFPRTWPYDTAKYNWLADPYGAAVNKTFWKIHGYVDSLIDKWLQAHNYKTISVKCAANDKTCYHWRTPWAGPMPKWAGEDDGTTKGPITGTHLPPTCERINRQQLGVIGARDWCSPNKVGEPDRPQKNELPTDPFVYASQSACSK